MPDPDKIFDLDPPPVDPDPGVTPPADPPVDPPPADPPPADPPADDPPAADPPVTDPPVDDLPEMYDSDEDYLKAEGEYDRGLPGHIKTIKDALAYGQSMATQASLSQADAHKLAAVNNALAQSGFQGGVEALIAGGGLGTHTPVPVTQPQQPAGGSFLPQTPYTAQAEEQIKANPTLKPEEAVWIRQNAAHQDRVYKQITDPIVSAMVGMAKEMLDLKAGNKNSEYRFLSKKMREAVPRFNLDAIINSGRAKTYEEAFIEYARTTRPDLLASVYGKGDQPPGAPPKTRRAPGMRVRTKSIQTDPMAPYRKYLDSAGEVDDAKLPKEYNEQVKIIKEIQRLTAPAK